MKICTHDAVVWDEEGIAEPEAVKVWALVRLTHMHMLVRLGVAAKISASLARHRSRAASQLTVEEMRRVAPHITWWLAEEA